MQTRRIDINCDLGEGKALKQSYQDARIMPYISRCNIACGGHAGDEIMMRRTLQCAKQYEVAAGAHPGYPDPENFGRRSMTIEFEALAESLRQQISQLMTIAKETDIRLTHIKLHGALYNDAEADRALAKKLVAFFHDTFPQLSLLVLANGEMREAALALNMKMIREGFMDRAYRANGHLVPRSQPNAVYDDFDHIVDQALALARNQPIRLSTGDQLKLSVDSICLHGDRPDARFIARSVFLRLQQEGIEVG
jgi:5-oxoprolinase (ATP-hydrolysing) subunit A